jgi:hypothetical protein
MTTTPNQPVGGESLRRPKGHAVGERIRLPQQYFRALLTALTAFLLSGCGDVYLPDGYGRRSGENYGDSVNGTAVLADMFAAAGHRVNSWWRLSPAIERVDVIVWFPDDIQPPSKEVVKRLEEWLVNGANPRTLVYIGRDFDAAPFYWQKVIPVAPAANVAEMKRRQVIVDSEWSELHGKLKDGAACDWFKYKLLAKPRDVRTLAGPWSAGVDPSKVEIQVHSRFVFDEAVEPLLASAGQTLVARLAPDAWNQSQVILVENGSFLLNLPLVNREHRRLASALIDEIQQQAGPNAPVVFLESGPGGPKISDEDPRLELPPGPADRPPLVYVWHHAILAGVLLVFASWSIFGRPRRVPPPPRSDFGQHVESLGALLEQTRDREYCKSRIEQYRAQGPGVGGQGKTT